MADRGRMMPHPVHRLNRDRAFRFRFEGRQISAFVGDTVASALYAAGIRVFSRSFKYHRPRGLLCVSGRCPNCLVQADGRPNVRACTEPAREGMEVNGQNAWPSVQRDWLSVIDQFHGLLPVGFYYKRMIRPRFLWPVYERVLRRMGGLGKIDIDRVPEDRWHKEHLHTDVAVVGGGPAGLTAALEAARRGVSVTLLDDQPELGGHLRHRIGRVMPDGPGEAILGFELGRQLALEVEGRENITLLRGAHVFGVYEGMMIAAEQGDRLIKLRARRLIVATGTLETPALFPNNDLPGVFLGRGVERLSHLYAVRPGKRAVVVSVNASGLILAEELSEMGVQVAAVCHLGEEAGIDDELLRRIRDRGIPLLAGHTVVGAGGRSRVENAVVALLPQGSSRSGQQTIPCDLICLAAGYQPASSLLYQAGCRLEYDPATGEPVPRDRAAGVWAAGEVAGTHHLPSMLLQGKIAGAEAALSLVEGSSEGAARVEEWRRRLREAVEEMRAWAGRPSPLPGGNGNPSKTFVCLCEDVTEKDVGQAVAEGYDTIETLKRYSTVSMGPCQGKMCSASSALLCSRATGQAIQRIGTTTTRPPVGPVTLGALAGKAHIPVKLTPMHHRHVAAGARMMNLGLWKRPETYATSAEEHRAVRERLALIDVSTLGKLDVQGKDAVRLLERIYTNKFAKLAVGRVRYGVMCDEGGIILDDGTVCRVAEDQYFITTTTGGVEGIEQWLTWWLEGTGLCVHITNVTAAYAAINVTGPRTRDLVAKLTEADLSNEALPYMGALRAEVAGVPSLLLRIGFVGELGYEMHFPAEYGEYMWDTLLEAGVDFGIAAFGVETQRILRLEKRNIIVGQDTDALSNPIEADMAWVVKLDKPDFIGKRALQQVAERGAQHKLVGFEMLDSSVVAEEGGQLVSDGRLEGRVTSSRFCPTSGRSIGMAWVPAQQAVEGAKLTVRIKGRDHRARVILEAFYDPADERMKV